MGQLVGAAVELGEGQALPAVHQGDGVRTQARLRGDQLVHRRVAVRRERRGVPAVEGGQVVFGQQRQVADGGVRLLAHGREHRQQLPVQALHGRRLEQVGGVIEVAADASVGVLESAQHQIELRALDVPLLSLAAQAIELQQRQVRLLLMVVADLEQRVDAQAARRLQRFHQLLERQVLMGMGAEQVVLHLLQQAAEALLAADLRAQHQGVDEEADQLLGLQLRTPCHRYADAQIALAGEAVQQGVERREEQHEQAGVATTSGLPHAVGQLLRQDEGMPPAPAVALGGARTVGRQFQHRMLVA
ncbi:hypothetical protein D9M71_266990 [compost metagenome]